MLKSPVNTAKPTIRFSAGVDSKCPQAGLARDSSAPPSKERQGWGVTAAPPGLWASGLWALTETQPTPGRGPHLGKVAQKCHYLGQRQNICLYRKPETEFCLVSKTALQKESKECSLKKKSHQLWADGCLPGAMGRGKGEEPIHGYWALLWRDGNIWN